MSLFNWLIFVAGMALGAAGALSWSLWQWARLNRELTAASRNGYRVNFREIEHNNRVPNGRR